MDRITLSKTVKLGKFKKYLDDYIYAGACEGFQVYFDKTRNDVQFVVIDVDNDYQKVATIDLTRSYKGKAWHCSYTQIDSKYQGRGLAKSFYIFIMKFGYVLEAGSSQSPGSRKLWYNLSKDRRVVMIAKTARSKEDDWVMPERNNKTKELKSDFFDIYDGAKVARVFAFIPRAIA